MLRSHLIKMITQFTWQFKNQLKKNVGPKSNYYKTLYYPNKKRVFFPKIKAMKLPNMINIYTKKLIINI